MPTASSASSAKSAVRQAILAGRRLAWGRSGEPEQRSHARDAHLLTWGPLRSAVRVASYVALATEPATAGLHAALLGRGVELCLPRLRPDAALDLVRWSGQPLPPGPRGVVEPPGDPLPASWPQVVVLPALAVDAATGVRLGRGGGGYDRLLSTLPADTVLVALLGDRSELQDLSAYAEWHDRPVQAAATPDGVHPCGQVPHHDG